MGSKINFTLAASLGALLSGLCLANDASYAADGTAPGSESKPPIVDWRSVEAGDYQTYVKNLQAIGCPDQTLRKIVTADVVTAFAGKRADALAARYQNFKYWKADATETEARAKLAAQRRAIDEEMNGVMQQLLGAAVDLPEVGREWKQGEWNYELSFLAPDKLEATKVILQEYKKVDGQMKQLSSGINLTEDTNELQRILGRYEEKRKALNQVLSAEEFKQVEMTTSWTAENLRHALVHFEPTEEEFRIIFEAWQSLDDTLSRIHATRQSDPGHLEKEAYAKIKAQLSAPRYEQYCATWWK